VGLSCGVRDLPSGLDKADVEFWRDVRCAPSTRTVSGVSTTDNDPRREAAVELGRAQRPASATMQSLLGFVEGTCSRVIIFGAAEAAEHLAPMAQQLGCRRPVFSNRGRARDAQAEPRLPGDRPRLAPTM